MATMNAPEGLLYFENHCWARREEGLYRLGITDYAQDMLGEISYVEVPSVGQVAEVNELLVEVEARKATSEIYAPISGQVVEVNGDLTELPQVVNDDPYGDGWLCLVSPNEDAEVSFMDCAEYLKFTGD